MDNELCEARSNTVLIEVLLPNGHLFTMRTIYENEVDVEIGDFIIHSANLPLPFMVNHSSQIQVYFDGKHIDWKPLQALFSMEDILLMKKGIHPLPRFTVTFTPFEETLGYPLAMVLLRQNGGEEEGKVIWIERTRSYHRMEYNYCMIKNGKLNIIKRSQLSSDCFSFSDTGEKRFACLKRVEAGEAL